MIAESVKLLTVSEPPSNPFPGLRPFEFHESLLYFGRDGQSEQLLKKLSSKRFMAVVGTSGSGKSSLVRAGLLPALFGGFLPSAGSDWRIAIMRPSNDPIGNLARALNSPDAFGASDEDEAKLQTAFTEATLRRGSLGLVNAVQQARMPEHECLLIVADQFEELFRFAQVAGSEKYQDDAAAFVKLLLEASQQRKVPIYVVLTMRSDFLGDCAIFWDLPEAINEGQYLIPRLTREQRREAITGPVAVCGGEISPRLINRLLNDMGDNPDQLPILQHALMRTWEKWKADHQADEAIDLRHYEEIGGMDEALSRHADEAYNELADDRSRTIAEKLFKGLTEKGADNREIRRPIVLAELCALTEANAAEVTAVIEVFRRDGRSFLMPPAEVPLDREALIDISHESLIRNWERLKKWVDEEARSARIYRRLAETAALHAKDEAGLWRDPDLQLALDWREQQRPNAVWAKRYHPDFKSAMDFLDQSCEARDKENEEKKKQRRKRIRLIGLFVLFLAVAFVFSLILGILARQRLAEALVLRSKAEAERKINEQLLYGADINLTQRAYDAVDLERGQQLLDAHFPEDGQEDQRGFEWYYLWRLYHDDLATFKHADKITAITFSPDGRMLASSSDDGTVKLLDAATHQLIATLKQDGAVSTIAFSPDSKMLATVVGNSKVELWDTASRLQLQTFNLNAVGGFDFSPDGKLLALSDSSGVKLWDIASHQEKSILQQIATQLVFSPDGKTLAINAKASGVKLWDMKSNRVSATLAVALETGQNDTEALSFSPDGKTLLYNDGNGVALWNTVSRRKLKAKGRDMDSVYEAAFSPDGKSIAIVGSSKNVFLEAIRTRRKIATFEEHDAFINAIAFSPDGKLLATGSDDKTVKLWDVATHQEFVTLKGHTGYLKFVAFSPDGKTLATADYSNFIKLWDVSAPPKHLTPDELHGLSTNLAFSPDGKLLAFGLEDEVKLLDNITHAEVATFKQESSLRNPLRQLNNFTLIFSPDSKLLAVVLPDHTVKLWSTVSHQEVAALKNGDKAIFNIVFSPDGQMLAVNEDQQIVRLLSTNSFQELATLQHNSDDTAFLNIINFSPDSKVLMTVGGDATLKLWDVQTHQELATLRHEQPIIAARFSPDGKLVATISRNNTNNSRVVQLWDTANYQVLTTVEAKSDATATAGLIAFSRDGQMLATVGGSNQILLWSDLDALQKVEYLHADSVNAVAFSPDGRTLVAGCGDKTVKLWDATSRRQLFALRHKDSPTSDNRYLMGYEDVVNFVTFAPDGKTLASLSDNGVWRLWYAAREQDVDARRNEPTTDD